MKYFNIFFVLLIVFVSNCSTQQETENLNQLWYNKPSTRWEEALPIGNGRLGAMIYGGAQTEQLQLNEETVWAGHPGNNINVEFKKILPEVRKMIFEGKFVEAQQYANEYFPRHAGDSNNYGMRYQPVGDLFINFEGIDSVENYKRTLDISKAVQTTTFKSEGINYKRETFASLTDDVIIIKLTADKAKSISCNLAMNSPHKIYDVSVKGDELYLQGISGDFENKLPRTG